jgi:alginate O-acetyltransferase complex protein AlgJ
MNPQPRRSQKAAHIVLVVLFAVAIALPGLCSLFGMTRASALQEKRRLAPFPAFRLSRGVLLAFPQRFEAYFNDHFAFRDQLVWGYNWAKVRCLGVSPCPNVFIGKDGWLYFREGLRDGNHAVLPFKQEELARWTTTLEERRQWLADQGIRFLVVVAPDKHTIYPEYLPEAVKPLPRESRLDQFMAYAPAHSGLSIIDLREPLLRAKSAERVYHKTDSHWNERGAFAGNGRVEEALAAWFPRIHPLSRSSYSSNAVDTEGGDLAAMLGLPGSYREDYLNLPPRLPRLAHAAAIDAAQPARTDLPEYAKPLAFESDQDFLPKAVIYHDSFGIGLAPFLCEHFRRIVTIRQDSFDAALIEREHPDVVLYEFVERRLALPPPSNDFPSAAKGAESP